MAIENGDPVDVPPIIPDGPNEGARDELLRRAADTAAGNGAANPEFDDPEWPEDLPENKPVRRKLLTAFAGLFILFVLLAAGLSWFFGIGSFSTQKVRSIDRTRSGSAPATEDEKLRAALSMVAGKDPVTEPGGTDGRPGEDNTVPVTPAGIPADGREVDRNGVFLPDVASLKYSGDAGSSLPEKADDPGMPADTRGDAKPAGTPGERRGAEVLGESESRDVVAPGRSLFFGIERRPSSQTNSNATVRPIAGKEREASEVSGPLPFGTLLPVRLVGAVFTLRNSGGVVRMELVRAVSGKGYAYPSGTQVVGTVRGSEYKRAFISVTGLIDPGTGQLVKFNGEVLGNDGASGMPGRQRSITGNWSRVLAGLRDTGRSVIGAIGNARSGGTVVISDQARAASGALSGQAAELIGGRQRSDEFVELAAGTTGYVLATGIPENSTVGKSEPRVPAAITSNDVPSLSGLTDGELAKLFIGVSPEELKAAMPRMTPEFRRLAAAILAETDGRVKY